jgi:hypothetical protein
MVEQQILDQCLNKNPIHDFFVVNNFITSCNGVGRNRSEFMHDVVDPDGAAASSSASSPAPLCHAVPWMRTCST